MNSDNELWSSSADDLELGLYLLICLARVYDAGGISAGRSMKSNLLSSALTFLPRDTVRLPETSGECWKALEEVEYRASRERIFYGQTHFFEDIRCLGCIDLGLVLLAGLERYYEEVVDDNLDFRSETDLEIIFQARNLLTKSLAKDPHLIERVSSKYNYRDLWEYARNKFYEMNTRTRELLLLRKIRRH